MKKSALVLFSITLIISFGLAAIAHAQGDVRRRTIAITYFKDPVTVRLAGTTLRPTARGEATVERWRKRNESEIDITIENMIPAFNYGGDYTTYVLWAITPAGQIDNLGEFRLSGGTARLKAATADHLEQANAAEIAALAEAGVQPVLLPASVYSLGKTRYPPAREMIEAQAIPAHSTKTRRCRKSPSAITTRRRWSYCKRVAPCRSHGWRTPNASPLKTSIKRSTYSIKRKTSTVAARTFTRSVACRAIRFRFLKRPERSLKNAPSPPSAAPRSTVGTPKSAKPTRRLPN